MNYCRSCYRPIPEEEVLCAACARTQSPRWHLVLGAAGLPLLVVGMLTLNVRLCVIGAGIAAAATVIHVTSSLR